MTTRLIPISRTIASSQWKLPRQRLNWTLSLRPTAMVATAGKIVEGIFAVSKPPNKSSGQLVRDLQDAFSKSELFAPWVQANRQQRDAEARTQRRKRRAKDDRVKIGHGGTLDPMATGVMIIGVGKGTKHLQKFLECTKTYEATILFGVATDTYDTEGKVLGRAPYEHLSKSKVETALAQFRGKIMQMPPLYSALKMNGKRLCDYAREGREIPREMVSRPVEVKELEITSWLEGGAHAFSMPDEEADAESKDLAESVLHIKHDAMSSKEATDDTKKQDEASLKRKRSLEALEDQAVKQPRAASPDAGEEPDELMSGALQIKPDNKDGDSNVVASTADEVGEKVSSAGPPAVTLRMTVTSGFYVRSLAHDLGKAVDSLACMCKLVRTRQGERELGRNVLEFEDLGSGEDIWGPKVQELIKDVD